MKIYQEMGYCGDDKFCPYCKTRMLRTANFGYFRVDYWCPNYGGCSYEKEEAKKAEVLK